MTALYLILSVVALFLIVAAATKKAYTVTREIRIAKPADAIFDYVKLLRNQIFYSKWVMTDPDKEMTISGIDGTPGAVLYWNGNKQAGEGEQEITEVTENERIGSEVRFVRPFKGVAQMALTLQPSADGTLVIWTFSSRMPYPVNVVQLVVNMEKMLGNDMQISLQNLKDILEHPE